ncbi:MAG: hypothetical protein ACOCYC_02920 [bacterium]
MHTVRPAISRRPQRHPLPRVVGEPQIGAVPIECTLLFESADQARERFLKATTEVEADLAAMAG